MKIFDANALKQIFAEILCAEVPDEAVIRQISTDTRTLQAGDTFVALSGEQFDGHQFITQAVEAGASAMIVETAQAVSIPQIIVNNTRLALAALATAIRQQFDGAVVGLTGSAGKTTNKQMIASILTLVGKTHATRGNLNNDLGVPFTWFDLPDDAEFAVIEMGANHIGEIDYLTKITQPNVAMITNAGQAHLAGFGGLDGVAKGKGELLANLTAGATAIINLDDAYADYWQTLLAPGVKIKTFSLNNVDADVYANTFDATTGALTVSSQNHVETIQLPTIGRHNIMNALGAATCALALGVDWVTIASGLSTFSSAKGRLQIHQCGRLVLIDDSYNANLLSMRASADIVAAKAGYRVLVLGDMGELGDEELALHAQLGDDLSQKADAFFCFGDRMRAFVKKNTLAQHFDDIDRLIMALKQSLSQHPQATVLVKGSRAMRMERVVEALLAQRS